MIDSIVRIWLNLQSAINSVRSGRQPPRQLPQEMHSRFTLNGQIPTMAWYLNDIRIGDIKWTTNSPWWNLKKVARKGEGYYKQTDSFLYESLEDFPLRNKDVVIVGSEMPWYECICHYYGANVTTIEYRDVKCRIPGLCVLKPSEFENRRRQFDAAISISSIEHDGLGRYGDPIDPDGDLRAMKEIRRLLKPDGRLYLSVPVGRDVVVWNAHRIYGPIRMPMLLEGWEICCTYGYGANSFQRPLGNYDSQPVFVLKPQRS